MPQTPPLLHASSPASATRLPKPPGVIRLWLAAHPRSMNATIVVCYLFGAGLLSLADWVTGGIKWHTLLVWVPLCGAVATALWFRTRMPMLGLILTVALSFFDVGGVEYANSVALIFFMYALPVYRSVSAGWIGYGITIFGVVANVVLNALLTPSRPPGIEGVTTITPWVTILPAVVWYFGVVMLGINMGNRRRYVAALVAHAEQLVRERTQQEQLAAAAERARIAREMHDIIAHSLSVVVTLTEAATVTLESQPKAAKHALERASETGRSALAEMRRLLGVLNEAPLHEPPTSERSPQPGISDLSQLCEGFQDAGLRITRSESGVPTSDKGYNTAVYRIVQEALTNALRYAGQGTQVAIELEYGATETQITVTDSGRQAQHAENGQLLASPPWVIPPEHTAPHLPGTGHGLSGAQQRAAMFGGELTAGVHGTGWRVTARIPYPMATSP